MPASSSQRRSTTGRRLAVTVTAPDGSTAATRGLARWLSDVAPASARGEVTVALVSDGRMRALNRSFRGKDYATDVLSFPVAAPGVAPAKVSRARQRQGDGVSAPPSGYLGDIVISAGVANRQADEAGHSVAIELRVLALHGLLHLLGYDHETDKGEMARAESRLRKKAGLTEGLITRMAARRGRRAAAPTRSR